MPALTALVDETHDFVSNQITDWIDNVDQFFGEEKFLDRENGSQLLVRYQATYDNASMLYEPKLRIRIDLPRTKQKLRLMIETREADQGGASVDDNASGLSSGTNSSEPDFFSTALQLVITMSDDVQLNARTGIAFRDGLDPFGLLSGYARKSLGAWNVRASQYIYQYARAGFGEETIFDVDRKLFDNMLLRFSSNLNWWYLARQFEASQSASLITSFTPSFAVSFNAVSEQASSGGWHNSNNFIFTSARWRFYKKWAFLQLTPQLTFRPEDYKPDPSITLGLEMLFGRSVDRQNFPHRPKKMETLEGPQRRYH